LFLYVLLIHLLMELESQKKLKYKKRMHPIKMSSSNPSFPRKLFTVIFIPLLFLVISGNAQIFISAGHPFVCTDYTQGKVFVVSADGKIELEYPAERCNDIWILPNGNLLFNTGNGVKEVTRKKKVVFSYESKSEIYACQRLSNGNTFIGECNTGRLLELNHKGKAVKIIKLLADSVDGGHAFMRNARKLKNGNYLVAHYGLEVVREYDGNGKLVREIPAPGGPHSVCRLPNGNTLIACADMNQQQKLFEVNPNGEKVWEIIPADIPEAGIKFMSGFQRLPNGNTVMTNWLGHNNLGKGAHVIEVTHDKRVVWTFADHVNMKAISSIQLVDIPGDVTRGEILH